MPIAKQATFPLASIKSHPDLQIRGGTDYTTVRRYARAMRDGAAFPPVQLAEVGGNLYIIDGHHRVEAALHAGRSTIPAIKRRTSLKNAICEAYVSNQAHGRRLVQKEQQHAFSRYIALGMHLDAGGGVKSFRRIASECPVYAFQTIGKKLRELGIEAPRDDVKSYAPDHYGYEELSDDEISLEQASLLTAFQEHLDRAWASYSLLDARHQKDALGSLVEVVRGLEDPLEI